MSHFWQQFGWSDYYGQLQTKVERLVADIERRYQVIGSKMPSTGNHSLRQAKQNVRQLMTDYKQRLAKDVLLMRNVLPSRRVTKTQNIDSMSLMEKGNLERRNGAGNSVHSDAEPTHESDNNENVPCSIKATCANVYSSTTQRMDEHEIFPNDSSVFRARMSLSTTGSVLPRTVLSSAVKSN
ncbi:unnamed protein product [Ceratitis capitata]|uniref:(Mediterranean fruit fly) hypothetical protein n=2 Tax=Ceratitis capitata TaxID=7213 RepID=A0A811VDN1_CERCA|nr:unnamed protein product [Ceratitis capitata]